MKRRRRRASEQAIELAVLTTFIGTLARGPELYRRSWGECWWTAADLVPSPAKAIGQLGSELGAAVRFVAGEER